MALAGDIEALARRTLSSLDESHDYYTYTKRMWRSMQQLVKEGRQLSFRNVATGSRLGEHELLDRLKVYLRDYLRPATFQDFVSHFEDFYFALLRHWLAAYPASMSRKQVDMRVVLGAADKTTIIASVIEKELNELKYERVIDWFQYLERLANVRLAAADIEKIAEIKASRDVLVHNNGIANAIYVAKSGSRARCQEGDRLLLSETYLGESWTTIKKVIDDLSTAAIVKARAKKTN